VSDTVTSTYAVTAPTLTDEMRGSESEASSAVPMEAMRSAKPRRTLLCQSRICPFACSTLGVFVREIRLR
jgi:hypothetical protein